MLNYSPQPGTPQENKVAGQLVAQYLPTNQGFKMREAESLVSSAEQMLKPDVPAERLANLTSFMEQEALKQRDINAQLVRHMLGN